MQFFYSSQAKEEVLKIDLELHKYIFKVRRHSTSEPLYFRNLEDKNIYKYEVLSINKKETLLKLISFEEKIIEPAKKLHIGWCVVDPKTVEKTIASLNELGVSKITFIYCKYSQKQFKINFEKIDKILQNSSSQCGRSSIIELDTIDSLDKFYTLYPDSYMFNFSSNHIASKKDDIKTIVLGCEGGFSSDEVKKFNSEKIVGIDTPLILRSETAAFAIASSILI